MTRGKRSFKDPVPTKGTEAEVKSFSISDASHCPHCSTVPEVCFKVTESAYQVPCSKCGMCGPIGKTVSMAVINWNSIPRGRPPIYEQIRIRALNIISEGLKVYEESLDSHKLTDQDCQAVAKMLEAATMAVDTWEL